ncbi:MAG: hypothetical protein CMF62_02560 [Magnetococcales bacterium]|nr:hypothetical protein [Magnetococcales bacterium]
MVAEDKDKKCSPGKKFTAGSCYTLDDLIAIAVAWNKANPTDQIKLSPKLDALNPQKYKLELVPQLEQRLESLCDDQKCWLRQDFVNSIEESRLYQMRNNTFRPEGPMGYDEWLSNFDIESSMKQYETKYTDFKFLGAVPLDFEDHDIFKIGKMNFNDLLKEGKTKIGIVINLDRYHQGGSHWVSAYADLNKGDIFFFDSYGTRPETEIRKFLRRIEKFCKSKGIVHTTVKHNKYRHQYGDGACGLYSMAFIYRLLKGDTFEEIIQEKVDDKEMNDCRKIYFS